MTRLPIYQVDAFTSELFGGNPAAVVPLDKWLPKPVVQSIAAENNLAETAYFVPREGGFDLRWFTPVTEVDLCGHATIASAWVLFERLGYGEPQIYFESRSGRLGVSRRDGLLFLDFPSRPASPLSADDVVAAVGGNPSEVMKGSRDHMLVYGSAEQVAGLTPDMAALAKADTFAVIATAPGVDCDFVFRFFAPSQGIPEDPATGSACCTLAPYWSSKLKKTAVNSRQISARGAQLLCEMAGDRVKIGGRAVPYLEGFINIP